MQSNKSPGQARQIVAPMRKLNHDSFDAWPKKEGAEFTRPRTQMPRSTETKAERSASSTLGVPSMLVSAFIFAR